MPRSRLPLLTAMLLALLALLAACGDGDADDEVLDVEGDAYASLRDVDFTASQWAGPLINRAGGGEVPRERIHYEDLTGDGVEEAVVVVESGGTLGDLAAGIYRLDGGQPVLDYFSQTGGRVEVRVGTVIFQSGVWDDDDAECCPSQLREVGVQWDGNDFTEVSDQVVDNPDVE